MKFYILTEISVESESPKFVVNCAYKTEESALSAMTDLKKHVIEEYEMTLSGEWTDWDVIQDSETIYEVKSRHFEQTILIAINEVSI